MKLVLHRCVRARWHLIICLLQLGQLLFWKEMQPFWWQVWNCFFWLTTRKRCRQIIALIHFFCCRWRKSCCCWWEMPGVHLLYFEDSRSLHKELSRGSHRESDDHTSPGIFFLSFNTVILAHLSTRKRLARPYILPSLHLKWNDIASGSTHQSSNQ